MEAADDIPLIKQLVERTAANKERWGRLHVLLKWLCMSGGRRGVGIVQMLLDLQPEVSRLFCWELQRSTC